MLNKTTIINSRALSRYDFNVGRVGRRFLRRNPPTRRPQADTLEYGLESLSTNHLSVNTTHYY